jgi:hypothetical protein
MKHLGDQHKIPMPHDLLQVNAQTFAFFNQSRLVIKDQWASHPSNEDREAHLRQLNIPSETIHQSAWAVFENPEALQERMTAKIFAGVAFNPAPQVITKAAFQEKYQAEVADYSFHKKYKGFYDNRKMSVFPVTALATEAPANAVVYPDLETILTDEACQLPVIITSLRHDIRTIKEIMQGTTGIRNVDFDGQKYSYKEAGNILKELTRDLQQAEEKLTHLDNALFNYFYQEAQKQGKGEALRQQYENLFAADKQTEADIKLYQNIQTELYPLFTANLSLEQAQAILNQVKLYEEKLKTSIRFILSETIHPVYCTPKQQNQLQTYLNTPVIPYLVHDTFDNEAITRLTDALDAFILVSSENAFKIMRNLLHTQLSYISTTQLQTA